MDSRLPVAYVNAKPVYVTIQEVLIIQFCIIYAPSQQLEGQLLAQLSVGTGIGIKDKHNIKTLIIMII